MIAALHIKRVEGERGRDFCLGRESTGVLEDFFSPVSH